MKPVQLSAVALGIAALACAAYGVFWREDPALSLRHTHIVRLSEETASDVVQRLRVEGTKVDFRVILEEPPDGNPLKARVHVKSQFTSLGPVRPKTRERFIKQYEADMNLYRRKMDRLDGKNPLEEAKLFEYTELAMAKIDLLQRHKGAAFISLDPPGLAVPGHRIVTRHPIIEILDENNKLFRDYDEWPQKAIGAKIQEGKWRRVKAYAVFLIPLKDYPVLADAAEVKKGLRTKLREDRKLAFNSLEKGERVKRWEAAKKARLALAKLDRVKDEAEYVKVAARAMRWVRRMDEVTYLVSSYRK